MQLEPPQPLHAPLSETLSQQQLGDHMEAMRLPWQEVGAPPFYQLEQHCAPASTHHCQHALQITQGEGLEHVHLLAVQERGLATVGVGSRQFVGGVSTKGHPVSVQVVVLVHQLALSIHLWLAV